FAPAVFFIGDILFVDVFVNLGVTKGVVGLRKGGVCLLEGALGLTEGAAGLRCNTPKLGHSKIMSIRERYIRDQ
ncbi:hypothetical protein Tco_0470151, partial [Tanacetum coccineum]